MGRTVLHLAILCNEPDTLRSLLANPELKDLLMAVDYENGWNILHYIYFYKRVQCLNVLMEHLDSKPLSHSIFMDLLKTKDRGRHAPLSLLANDIKDLAWVPSYINEKNEYHLVQRFDTPKRSEDSDSVENKVAESKLPHRLIPHDWWSDSRGASDIYVFGANVNNNLGVGDSTDRITPSHLLHFEFKDETDKLSSLREILRSPRYKIMRISKYHSVILTNDGRIYTCGVGSRGRLGHGNSSNMFRFKRVQFPDPLERFKDIAVTNNHNLALSVENDIYSWGHNNLNQLGFTSTVSNTFRKTTTDVYENTPKIVAAGDLRKNHSPFLGVAISKVHSLAYTSNSVYFWGLNIGQMGLELTETSVDHTINGIVYKGQIVSQPREVSFRDKIKFVVTCETCTCIVTESNDIHIYYMGQRVKLPKLPTRVDTASQFDSFKPSKLTSPAVIKKIAMKSHENVHILLENGNVMSFQLGSTDLKTLRGTKYSFLWLAHDIDMYAVDIDNSYDGSVIVSTRNGSVFAKCNQSTTLVRKSSTGSSTLPAFQASTKNKFRKIENINRALKVVCDDSFSSFAVLRDEIDPIPFKLQKNEFRNDMAYLSPLSYPSAYRKQDEMLYNDHYESCYIANFMHPHLMVESSVSTHVLKSTLNHESSDSVVDTSKDFLRSSQVLRFSREIKKPSLRVMYLDLADSDLSIQLDSLSPKFVANQFSQTSDNGDRKFCDCFVTIVNREGLRIPFHFEIMRSRSRLFRQILDENDIYFVHDGMKGRFDQNTRELHFETDVNEFSVLIWLHYVYTNHVVELWAGEASKSHDDTVLKLIKNDFHKLVAAFKMDQFHCNDEQYLSEIQSMMNNQAEIGGTQIILSNHAVISSTALLVARTAFFETTLSGRWLLDGLPDKSLQKRIIDLDYILLEQAEVVLRHVHGCNDLDIFNSVKTVVETSKDPEDFVLFLLDMIEISDELLLLQLKHVCELAVSEFFTLNNVLILLVYSDQYNAQKLFKACCWYIYNNLDILLFDSLLRELDSQLVTQVENEMRFFDNCKHRDFVLKHTRNFQVNSLMGCAIRGEVNQFLENSNSFNEIYMSDRKGFLSFQLLVDLRQEMLPSKEPRKKLNARRSSRKGSFDTAFKNFAISRATKSEDSDIAVVDEEEFEIVSHRKRKDKYKVISLEELSPSSSKSLKEDAKTWQVDKVTETVSVPSPPQSSSLYVGAEGSSRNASSGSLASISPALGESIETVKKQTKIKFSSALKLSQKQRKKLAEAKDRESQTVETAKPSTRDTPKTPWKVNVPSSSETSAAPSNLTNMPILGQALPVQPKARQQDNTKWTDRVVAAPIKKTLQEVQQEEEFAKWWEEESKRVQMEMSGTPGSWNGSTIARSSQEGNSTNHSMGRRGGRGGGKGRRGGRPPQSS